jgi:hypothetical protein
MPKKDTNLSIVVKNENLTTPYNIFATEALPNTLTFLDATCDD